MHIKALSCFLNAAHHWYGFGLSVIPIFPGTKQTAVKWDTWLENLSPEHIQKHWTQHPDHEIGLIVGDDLIVFDADSPTATAALAELEKAFDVSPALTVTTAKGEHHYFKRAADTYAKSDSHSTEEHPERIDVKTSRAQVLLPPSTGKVLNIAECEYAGELTEASQKFIDAVFIHNGRQAPRAAADLTIPAISLPADMDRTCTQLNAMLQHVDPDCGYEDWLHVLMAIYHGTGGGEDGLALAIDWSSKGRKYQGEDDIRVKWRSFSGYSGAPITVGTLHKMLQDKGIDWMEVCMAAEPQFTRRDTGTVYVKSDACRAHETVSGRRPVTPIPFRQYSLTGQGEELEAEALDQVYVLESIALLGQWTVLYARHNTGKTLIVIHLLMEAIRQGALDGDNVFYFDLDDTHLGLAEKTRIAEETGFHVLCDGYNEFRVADFIDHIEDICDGNQAKGIVLVLDTLKKFTDLMDKRKVSRWNEVIRRFVAKGGTVIGLAHVNKNPGTDGKPVYAGTTDMIDDADCAYVLDEVSIDGKTRTKVVEFENRKRRGNVANSVSYGFSVEDGLSYRELLATVRQVNESELVAVKQAEETQTDAVIIAAVVTCINEGITAKMRLQDAVRERTGCSKRAALEVIEKYTGSDPATHRWAFDVGERGAKRYRLLDTGTPSTGLGATGT